MVRSITLCMGSSCFSRGNNLNAEFLSAAAADSRLAAEVHQAIEVKGTLCEGLCKEGPIVIVDGVVHRRVTLTMLRDLLGIEAAMER